MITRRIIAGIGIGIATILQLSVLQSTAKADVPRTYLQGFTKTIIKVKERGTYEIIVHGGVRDKNGDYRQRVEVCKKRCKWYKSAWLYLEAQDRRGGNPPNCYERYSTYSGCYIHKLDLEPGEYDFRATREQGQYETKIEIFSPNVELITPVRN